MNHRHPTKKITVDISDLETAIDAVMEKHLEHKSRSQENQKTMKSIQSFGDNSSPMVRRLDAQIAADAGMADSYLNVAMRLKESLEKA